MKRFVIAATVAVLAIGAYAAEIRHQPIVGKVDRVIDGDTIVVVGRHLRLHGIDAPESAQNCYRPSTSGQGEWPCGKVATNAMQRIVQDHKLVCEDLGKDRYKRTLARCWDGKVDIERTMVVEGFAVAYRRYSHDYDIDEDEAKRMKRGLWGSVFEMPWDWRKAHRVGR